MRNLNICLSPLNAVVFRNKVPQMMFTMFTISVWHINICTEHNAVFQVHSAKCKQKTWLTRTNRCLLGKCTHHYSLGFIIQHFYTWKCIKASLTQTLSSTDTSNPFLRFAAIGM